MTQKLQELDRSSQIRQVLQWFKDDPYLLQCFLDDPDDALAQLKEAGHEMSEDAVRQLKSLIFERGGFEAAYDRFFPPDRIDRGGPAVTLSAPPIKGGGQKAAPERIVSTGFADEGDAATPHKPELPLKPATNYYFWLEVGSPVEGSIEVIPTKLPEEIPPGAKLDVALFGFENELELRPGKEVGRIQIEADGTVTVLTRVAEPAVGEEMLSRRLFFPVKTANRERPQRLRCNIYYQQTLIQSRLVSVKVAANPVAGSRPALASRLDYTLSKSLNGEILEGMGTNTLSMMLNDNGNGTHGFRFFGQNNFKNDATLTEGALKNLIEMARGGLRKVAWGDEEEFKSGKEYRYADGTLNEERLRSDLITLAIRGRRFYTALIEKLAGGIDNAWDLEEMMLQSGQVQIASKVDASLVVPAAMFYDYVLDEGKETKGMTICEAFIKAVRSKTPLEQSACFQGNCPSRGQDTVVCPSGFWGFRHNLGLPVSIKKDEAEGDDAAVTITYSGTPRIAMSVSTDKNFRERAKHEQALRSLNLATSEEYADSRDEAVTLMKATKSQIIYFYCHGGLTKDGVPFISVGDPTGDWLTTTTLFNNRVRWRSNRPLVFINGCHTTALTPEYALNFVQSFVQTSNAAGVVGTEITIFEPIATNFAEECFKQFLQGGKTLGEAVRGARLKMLQDGNPLGLVYIPYAVPGLKVAPA
jgi:hypothetical protein